MRPLSLLWIVAVVLLSFLPLRFKLAFGTTGPWHNWGHFLVFTTTVLVLCWNPKPRLQQSLRVLAILLFGIALEYGEVLIYHNIFEWHDVLIDCLGAFAGMFVLRGLQRVALR